MRILHLVAVLARSARPGTTHADYFYGAYPRTRPMTVEKLTASTSIRPAVRLFKP